LEGILPRRSVFLIVQNPCAACKSISRF
jgi:hypothetical protein